MICVPKDVGLYRLARYTLFPNYRQEDKNLFYKLVIARSKYKVLTVTVLFSVLYFTSVNYNKENLSLILKCSLKVPFFEKVSVQENIVR